VVLIGKWIECESRILTFFPGRCAATVYINSGCATCGEGGAAGPPPYNEAVGGGGTASAGAPGAAGAAGKDGQPGPPGIN
jgi:hypothetical protein